MSQQEEICHGCGGPRSKLSGRLCRACYRAKVERNWAANPKAAANAAAMRNRQPVNSMRSIDYGRLESLVVQPGMESKLIPLALYKGALSLGDVHKRWNMTIAAMLADLKLTQVKWLWEDPSLSKLCFPNTRAPISSTSLYSWFGRLLAHRNVVNNVPGLWNYIQTVGGKFAFTLDQIPLVATTYEPRVWWRDYLAGKRNPRDRNPKPQTAELFYPFLIQKMESGVNEGYDLLLKINSAVPKGLPDQVRADVCQDLAVAILSGDMSAADLENEAPVFVSKVMRMYPTKYGPISLDQQVPWADGLTLLDMLTGYGVGHA